jgi:hypothetical protein
MFSETAIFPISSEAFQSSKRAVHVFGPMISTKNMLDTLKSSHPLLAEYTVQVSHDEPEHADSYLTGVLFTYDVLSRQEPQYGKPMDILPQDISLHKHNYEDQQPFASVDLEQPEVLFEQLSDASQDSGAIAFLRRLEHSSPELLAFFKDKLCNRLSSADQRRSFLRGVYDAYMPFYNKNEAEYLYDHLDWLPSLEKAFTEGYYKRD